MEFDPKSPVRTRGGRKARILCTDAQSSYPVIALVMEEDGMEHTFSYTAKGKYTRGGESHLDLVNVPTERPHAAAIQRWAEDGRVICEVQSTGTLGWTKTDTPTWKPYASYRLILNGELILTSLAKE